MSRTPMIRGWKPAAPAAPQRRHTLPWPLFIPLLLLLLILRPPADSKDTQAYAMPTAAPVLAQVQARLLPDAVRTALPAGETSLLAVPSRRLARGKLLLIDEHHPLPAEFLPGDTLSVLGYTQGRVTCRDLAAVSGQDTLDALLQLFAAARNDRIIQLTVFAGTRSAEQQRLLLTDTLAAYARDMSLEEAMQAAREAVASPDCSEHQTGWAVDVRICPVWNGAPDDRPYAASDAGRWLQANCWRFGFIVRWPSAAPAAHSCRAWHLRYVGRAHAMLMHSLNVSLEEYLELLHQHGTLTLLGKNEAPLACAICVPAGEHQTSFHLPNAQIDDLSLDNQGWAVASCLFTESIDAP